MFSTRFSSGDLGGRNSDVMMSGTLGTCLIGPLHPVAQALAGHAANHRRIPTFNAIINRRNRQNTAHLFGYCRGPRLGRVKVRSPRDLRRRQILQRKPAFYESHHCAIGNPKKIKSISMTVVITLPLCEAPQSSKRRQKSKKFTAQSRRLNHQRQAA